MEVLTYKPRYIEFLLRDIDLAEIPEKRKFIELIQYRDIEIAVDEETGAAEWKKHAKNTPTVGEEFGFLTIISGYQEGNHCGEGYRWASNLY